MRKGTFSVQNASSHSSKHNSRELSPKYLIGLENHSKNYYELILSDDDFREKAEAKYKETFKQNMQKAYVKKDGTKVSAQKDLLIKETVITLKKEQNENDVKALFKELNLKFGGHHLTEISIHRDEGHFVKNGIAYYPTKNILKKENAYYICSNPGIEKPKKNDFDLKVDISEFEKVYNYHAHAKFSNFDLTTGKTAKMNKSQMSKRIKFVSEFLELDYNPSKDRHIHKSVNQIKDEHLVKATELAKVKDLNALVKDLRAELQENKATRADYAKLEKLNKELKAQIKQQNLDLEKLKSKMGEFNLLKMNQIQELKNDNKSLQAEKRVLEENLSTLEEKRASEQNIEHYDIEKDIKNIEKEEFKEKEVKTGIFGKKETVITVKDSDSFKNRILNSFSKMLVKAKAEAHKFYKNLLEQKDLIINEKEEQLEQWIAYGRENANGRKKLYFENQELKEKLNLNSSIKQQKKKIENPSDAMNKIKKETEEITQVKVRRNR